ncbi:MAG: hypothetical protein AAGH57_00725 [Pseudomonadota bacterium]
MRKAITAVAVGALWASTSLAEDKGTQDSAVLQADDPRIVVEAPRTDRERRAELRNMVTNIINKPREGRTVATYFKAICPRVIGLPEAETRVIEERIRDNAEALGVNHRAAEKCKPNVTVVFVPPSKGPPEAWLTADNDMLGHLLSYQRSDVLQEEDPVRAWTFNEVRSADGAALPEPNGQRIAGPLDFANPVRLLSRLRTNATVEITGAAVMIELTSAMNKTLGQLADYASMRTFGNSRSLSADAKPAADTILTLFRDEDPPEGLTTFDRAVISKLYDTSRNSLARRYYNNIAGRAFEMEKEENAQNP